MAATTASSKQRGGEDAIDWLSIGRILAYSWPLLVSVAILVGGFVFIRGGNRILVAIALAAAVILSATIPAGRKAWVWTWRHSWGALKVRLDWEHVCQIQRWFPAKVRHVSFGSGWLRFHARIPHGLTADRVIGLAPEIASILEARSVVVRNGASSGWVEVVVKR